MIGPSGFMAGPKAEQEQPDEWHVEGCNTYKGRGYWSVWKRNPKVYGGRQYLPTPRGTDRKRFYDERKAEAAAAKMNSAAVGALIATKEQPQ